MTTAIEAFVTHDGTPPFDLLYRINHKQVDGAHVFTSDDIPGLLVASQSLDNAIVQLPLVIKELMLKNRGFKCNVRLGVTRVMKMPEMAIIQKEAA